MTALLFMDTETTGLDVHADIWEFAAIRRETSGVEHEYHLFIDHDLGKCDTLPAAFRADHDARFPEGGSAVVTRRTAAAVIYGLTQDRPHIVGAVPNFDTERIAFLLRDHGYEAKWHYHLIDVENLAIGYLAHQWRGYADSPNDEAAAAARLVTTLPWDSDEISAACGVVVPRETRHTAMGDARWARALYDAVIGPTPTP